ncbi:MAG: DUF5672 family protein [Lentisphaerae bacterium]|nr:DUF5672 family protein [Lentisphaerota bacterium]
MKKSLSPENIVVVIPSEKLNFSDYEKLSLTRCRKMLSRYSIIAVLPEKFRDSRKPSELEGLKFEYFPDRCFRSTRTYSRLLLSAEFYTRFRSYEYMLIHQADVMVFRDELLEWAEKGYDYIGAPWLAGDSVKEYNPFVGVGNGGLSLRKISSFIDILEKGEISHTFEDLHAIPAHFGLRNLMLLKVLMHMKEKKINLPYRKIFIGFFFTHRRPNEDIFWGAFARLFSDNFKIPSCDEALKFSVEVNPRRCFEILGRKLPFGCHAWTKCDKEFWEETFQKEFTTNPH